MAADEAALRWWLDAGVDTLVGDAPRDWLAATYPQPVAAIPVPATARDGDVARLARRCTSAADVRAALATLHPDPVFPDGEPAAGLLLLGEVPTAEDARAGRPFTGTAGRLLLNMLATIGRDHATACLGNVNFWAGPPAPGVDETMPLLRRLIALVRPAAIVALGGPAAAALAGAREGVNRLRGKWIEVDFEGATVPVLPTFHPQHLLAHPAHKALAWDDLQTLRSRITH